MAKKAMSRVKALRAAVKKDPFDLARRLVLADALEEEGGVNDATFQRLLVRFVGMVRAAVDARWPGEVVRGVVGATDGPVYSRVFTVFVSHGKHFGDYSQYCWTEVFLAEPATIPAPNGGPVRRGSWKNPAGPVRFYLAQGPEAWARHITPYGLVSLRQLDTGPGVSPPPGHEGG